MNIKSKNVNEQQVLQQSQEHLKAVAQRAYSGQKKQFIDDEQIVRFLPMVHKIVHRVVKYLRPPLSFDDLVSAGTIGLIKAARDYDPSHQAEFKTYAYIRIRGAVLDELRGSSLLPANLNKQIQDAFRTSREVAEQTGSVPTDEELAEKLGITVEGIYELFENARAQQFLSLDGFGENNATAGDFLEAADTTTPDKQLEKAELVEKLTEAIEQLDRKRRQVILLYYQQHLTMKEIAEVLKITESRISQLHASALFNLFVTLRRWNHNG